MVRGLLTTLVVGSIIVLSSSCSYIDEQNRIMFDEMQTKYTQQIKEQEKKFDTKVSELEARIAKLEKREKAKKKMFAGIANDLSEFSQNMGNLSTKLKKEKIDFNNNWNMINGFPDEYLKSKRDFTTKYAVENKTTFDNSNMPIADIEYSRKEFVYEIKVNGKHILEKTTMRLYDAENNSSTTIYIDDARHDGTISNLRIYDNKNFSKVKIQIDFNGEMTHSDNIGQEAANSIYEAISAEYIGFRENSRLDEQIKGFQPKFELNLPVDN